MWDLWADPGVSETPTLQQPSQTDLDGEDEEDKDEQHQHGGAFDNERREQLRILFNFCKSMRSQIRKYQVKAEDCRLTEVQYQKLESIGLVQQVVEMDEKQKIRKGVTNSRHDRERFYVKSIQRLKEYKLQHGHCNLPAEIEFMR